MNKSLFALALVSLALLAAGFSRASAEEPSSRSQETVDATTLTRKVLCGYQGWFRCPGDGSGEGWRHWSRDSRHLTPDRLTFEMWPDMSEYSDQEKFAAPGFTLPDGSLAQLFSSHNARTVLRHFEWMQQYGIDGVFVQRFLVSLRSQSGDRVLEHVRAAAGKTGRIYAIGYDLSGMPERGLIQTLRADWTRCVDEMRVTKDDRYLRHDGKPVVFVWGFFPDRFSAATAHQLIDLFKQDDQYAATLIGGCPWSWQREDDPEWARAFRRFDVISPWNVGNVTDVNGQKHATTDYWKDDLAEVQRHGMRYLPVVYPGFGWSHLKGNRASGDSIPRLGGEFFWRQFAVVGELGIEMAYVSMFDEVDEATAVFKVSNTPPREANFQSYEGLPSDWYLRLTAAGAEVVRGERKASPALPFKP